MKTHHSVKSQKIAIVVPSLKSGGLERVATLLSNEIAKNNAFEVTLICLSRIVPFYPVSSQVKLVMVSDLIQKSSKNLKIVPLAFWLRNNVKKEAPTVVLSFGEGYNAFVIGALAGLGLQIFVSNRASPLSSLVGFRGIFNPLFYKYSAGVFVQTNKAKEMLLERYSKSKFYVIPNPFILPELPLEQKENIILNVGSIGGKKNQDWLICYFASLTNWRDWTLCFVGDGARRTYCEELARDLGVASNVLFVGKQKDVNAFYARAKIFAFTSTSEGFPNALGEAMAAGLATISYDCTAGPADMIDDTLNGFLIPMGASDTYTMRLQQLCNDTILQKEIGARARQKMTQFSIDNIVKRYLDILIYN